MKNDRIIVRASSEFVEEIQFVSKQLDRPVSQIVREAVAEKLAEIKADNPSLFANETAKVS